jgi:flagellar biosynthesis/type III secretory pathway M-ring protein FliF/YscJ
MARELLPCGTVAAYVRHRRHGEDACEPCLTAWAAESRARRDANRQIAEHDKARNRVRRLAAAVLIKRHRAEFEELLAEAWKQERARQWDDVFAEFLDEEAGA